MKRYSFFLYVALFAFVFLLDRVTKFFIVSQKVFSYSVTSFLSFDLTLNRGVSWGMFDSQSTLIFSFVSILIVGVTFGLMLFAYWRLKDGYNIAGEVLAIAGSLSNIVDRIVYGGVVDFISFHYGTFSWPIFNIADVCIVVGIFFVLINMLIER